MSKGTSRRQWLLGLVGAVFGAGAARAVERWLPQAKGAAKPATLSLTVRMDQGGECTMTGLARGKVVIEYEPRTGTLSVTEQDANGTLVARRAGSVRCASIALPPGP